LEFSDYSVKVPFNSANADYIRSEITKLLSRVSVTVVLIGTSTYTSDWVKWEITKSREMGKGLVGVRLHSAPTDITPSALTQAGAQVINWDLKAIVAAIEQAAKRAGY
jgi:MTH538 TIR-like domain (DUF1863)